MNLLSKPRDNKQFQVSLSTHTRAVDVIECFGAKLICFRCVVVVRYFEHGRGGGLAMKKDFDYTTNLEHLEIGL